jgi:alanine racemase
VERLKNCLEPGAKMGVVIKSNAYGHGIKIVSLALREEAEVLIVFSISEALAVRAWTGEGRILVVGPPSPTESDLDEALRQGIELTVAKGAWLGAIFAAAERSGATAELHLKLDTGTNRQGMATEELMSVAMHLLDDPRVHLRGISTHFADIEDTLDHSYAQTQFERFTETADSLDSLLGTKVERHSANSAATVLWPRTHGSFVRAGLASYGFWPSRETFLAVRTKNNEGLSPRLEPVLEWTSRVTEIRQLNAGDYVGYGRSFRCTGETRIAVVPVGYADGYSRSLSNKGHMLADGVRAPIRGRVCMNMTMIDVTDIPDVQIGTEVTMLGSQGSEVITAEDLADWMGTINYEVCTSIAASIPRIAVDVPEELVAPYESAGVPSEGPRVPLD